MLGEYTSPEWEKMRRRIVEKNGKVALITGGVGGLGLATAVRYTEQGFAVAICDRKDGTDRHMPRGSKFYHLDVTDEEEATEVAAHVVEDFGGLDVVVDYAGITKDRSFEKMTCDDFTRVVAVSLTGSWIVAHTCLPFLKKRGGGNIILVSSINGVAAVIGQTNYGPAKAGVAQLARDLGRELARFNILVNAIAPGYCDTEMVAAVPKDVMDNVVLPQIWLRRLGKPSEIADAAYWLGVQTFMTGEVLHINGGMAH